MKKRLGKGQLTARQMATLMRQAPSTSVSSVSPGIIGDCDWHPDIDVITAGDAHLVDTDCHVITDRLQIDGTLQVDGRLRLYNYPNAISELGDVVMAGLIDGEILVWNATTGKWNNGDASALGVVGPAAGATDNALARWDTATGRLLQDSVAILTDAGALSGLALLTMDGNIDLNGNDLILDVDGDSYLHSPSDVVVDLVLAGMGGEFAVNINGNEDFRFISGELQIVGDVSITSSASANPVILIENTNADSQAPTIDFYKNTASPAHYDDLGAIDFYGETSTGAKERYAYILAESLDVTNGDTGGGLRFSVVMDAVERNLLQVSGYSGTLNQGEVIVNEAGQDVDFRVEAASKPNAMFVRGDNGFLGLNVVPSGILHIAGEGASDTGAQNFTQVYAAGATTALRPTWYTRRSRGTLAALDAVVDNDALSRFEVTGWDGTATWGTAVQLKCDVDGAVGLQSVPGRFIVATTPVGSISPNDILAVTSNGRVGVTEMAPLAMLHIDQANDTAAIPVLLLDQADVSEEMIQFETTIGVGNAIEAIAAKTLTTTHFIKVTLPGGLTRYISCGTIA